MAGILVEAISLPVTVAGLGGTMLIRCGKELSWVAVPIGVSMIAGKMAALLPFATALSNAVWLCSWVTAVYLGLTWLCAPGALRQAFAQRIGGLMLPGVPRA
jgi:hypothetical protein